MALIINGKQVPCDANVINWTQHGMEVKPGKGARKRDVKKTQIDLFVLHWSGGEGSARTLFTVLNKRELGIEFYLDDEGNIYQFCDPILVDTFDAGAVNPRSIGIEIKSYGFRTKAADIPSAGRSRVVREETINNSKIRAAQFTEKQLIALEALIKAVCEAMPSIPMQIPVGADGKPTNKIMTPKQLREYKGLIGHYHISSKKFDPGLHVFEWLQSRGIKGHEIK